MKKGLAIGLVVVIAILATALWLGLNPPDRRAPSGGGTETAMELATPPVAGDESEEDAAVYANEDEAEEGSSTAAAPGDVDVPAFMQDRVLGNPDAPVTIVEYASLTCPHCANFANTILPEVKAKLIDTGKAKLIYRDFPLDQRAMRAAMLSRCVPAEQYFDFIEVLFHNQERWAHAEDFTQALMQYGMLAGMDQEYMTNCMGNEELQSHILRVLNAAQDDYQINSTPTFVFNYGKETLSGALDYAKFEDIVNRLAGE